MQNAQQPLVTIIAISYNQEDYVEATLNSIKNQTYPNIQLIISDDGSKDNTKEIIHRWVKEYCPSAIFLDNEVNVGITKNLNRALPYIKGGYVKQIGCDDILLPDSVQMIMDKFAELPEDYGVIYTDMHRINEQGQLIDNIGLIEKRGHPVYSGYVYKEMIKRPFITSASIIFKKDVIDKLHGFNEKVFYEDHDTYLRASKYFKFHYIPEKTVKYRVHGASLINSSSRIKYFVNEYNVYMTSYDGTAPYKEIFDERLLFCIKNMYANKFKQNFAYCMRTFLKSGNFEFVKFGLASIPFWFGGKNM
jgi:glycosyltransferase involved in cell wall biosynthesis